MDKNKLLTYANYGVITLAVALFGKFSFDYIIAHLDTLKYFYPIIPLVASTYIIGVTLVSTKIFNSIKNKITKENQLEESLSKTNDKKIDYQITLNNENALAKSHNNFKDYWKDLTQEEKEEYVNNNLVSIEGHIENQSKPKTYIKKRF